MWEFFNAGIIPAVDRVILRGENSSRVLNFQSASTTFSKFSKGLP